MTVEECKHGLMAGTCSLCAPRLKPVPAVAERTTTARFDGACPGCLGRVAEGDTIGLVDGEWFCWRCTV